VTRVQIPLAKPLFDEREVEAVRRVLASGWVVQGPEVEAFEQAVAVMHRARHCIAVTSGTTALHLCYLALGIGPGDAVFIPSFAWPSAANMAVMCGARPVYVDVLPGTYNIDPADLRRRIAECTTHGWGRPRAVVPVHEFGLASDLASVGEIARQHGMELIEDGACALGATYHGRPVGTFGRLGVFSFHPRKAVTTGEGGAVVTNDDALAERCRMLRNHGQVFAEGRRDFVEAANNYRMTEIQAAIGRVQLEKFPEILATRRRLVAGYLARLSDLRGARLPTADREHTWQTFMVVLDDDQDRDDVVKRLSARGIGAGAGSVAGHAAKVYRQRYGYTDSDLPVSLRLDRQGLALPLHASMTDAEIDLCTQALAAELRA
jgi:dTDP-4-amino-4,6-dideoxygalactose transaminase